MLEILLYKNGILTMSVHFCGSFHTIFCFSILILDIKSSYSVEFAIKSICHLFTGIQSIFLRQISKEIDGLFLKISILTHFYSQVASKFQFSQESTTKSLFFFSDFSFDIRFGYILRLFMLSFIPFSI